LFRLADKRFNPIKWINGHIPRSQVQLETEARGALKLVFWAALLAPVVIVPAYYLLVAFGVLPPIHLPG
jgi:hypothetical protein